MNTDWKATSISSCATGTPRASIPVVYTKYSVTIPEWLNFHLEETGMSQLENKQEFASMTIGDDIINTETNIFIGHNLPALKADDYIWCAADYGCKVTHELQSVTIPGYVYKDYSVKWETIDETLFADDEFGGRIKKSSPLKDEMIAAGIPQIADAQERFDATWKLLRQRVRWNGDYAFWAKSGSKVLKEGTGTNADMNFLLINMLHDAGIEAEPVVLRLRNRGRLPLSHASLKYLSTFVVAVELNDSTTAFFDSSAEDGYLNVLPACLSVERARLIRKGKSKLGGWVNLQNMALATERSFIQATLTDDGQLSGTMANALDGEAAAALRKRWRTAKDSTEVIHQMQEDKSIEISDYRLQGRHDFSPNLRETITVHQTVYHGRRHHIPEPAGDSPYQQKPIHRRDAQPAHRIALQAAHHIERHADAARRLATGGDAQTHHPALRRYHGQYHVSAEGQPADGAL